MSSPIDSEATIAASSTVQFYVDLSLRLEDDAYLTGRKSSGDFVALPEVGGQVIKLLQEGRTIEETQRDLSSGDDSEIDVQGFVETLVDLGFVCSIDGRLLGRDLDSKDSLPWIKQRHSTFLFSPIAKLFWLTTIVAAVVVLFQRPHLLPSPKDFLFLGSIGLSIAGNMIAWFAVGGLHELSHLLAARSLGIGSRIELSTRLHHLAFQTSANGLWSVPKELRYRAYFAGMAFNLFFFSVLALSLRAGIVPTGTTSLVRMLMLVNLLGILGELHLYVRTDVYFFAQDFFSCRNLYDDSLRYLGYLARRLTHTRGSLPSNPIENLPRHEQRAISIYAWILLIGSTLALSFSAFYGVSTSINVFRSTVGRMQEGFAGSSLALIDGLVGTAAQVFFYGMLVFAFVKTHPTWFKWLSSSPPAQAPAH